MDKKIPITIALILGVLMAGFGYHAESKKVQSATTTVSVVTPKTDIEAYSKIDPENLTTKQIPPNIVDKNTVIKVSQIGNMTATVPLYAGKPVDLRDITDAKKDNGDKQVVGVYIDAARCAGVTEGDIVDIYRIGGVQGEAAPRVAANCRVIRITDEKGIPVKGASAIIAGVGAEGVAAKTPRIVYLLVEPWSVPYVIQGANDKSLAYLALSKKSKETVDPAPVTPVTPVAKTTPAKKVVAPVAAQ